MEVDYTATEPKPDQAGQAMPQLLEDGESEQPEEDNQDEEEEEKEPEIEQQPELPPVDVRQAASSSNVFLQALAARQSSGRLQPLPEVPTQSRQAWWEDNGESLELEDEVDDEAEQDEVEQAEQDEIHQTFGPAFNQDDVEEEDEEGNEYEEYQDDNNKSEADYPMVVDTKASSQTWPAFHFPEAIQRLERAAVKQRKKSFKKLKKPRTCPRHPDDQLYIDFLEKNRPDTVSLAHDRFSDMTAQMKRMAKKMEQQAADVKQMTADMAFLKEKLSSLEKMVNASQASLK